MALETDLLEALVLLQGLQGLIGHVHYTARHLIGHVRYSARHLTGHMRYSARHLIGHVRYSGITFDRVLRIIPCNLQTFDRDLRMPNKD
jgi:hypothetical protein